MHALVYNAKLGKVALLIDSLPGARVVGVILASFRATLAVGPIIWVVYTVRAVLIINVVTAECPLRLRIWGATCGAYATPALAVVSANRLTRGACSDPNPCAATTAPKRELCTAFL